MKNFGELLLSRGLTLEEATLFEMTNLLTLKPLELTRRAVSYRSMVRWFSCTDHLSALRGLVSCIEKNLLQIVDRCFLTRISKLTKGFSGPLHGFPPLGTVSFTTVGAKKYLAADKEYKRLRRPTVVDEYGIAEVFDSDSDIRSRRYFASLRSADQAVNFISTERSTDLKVVRGPRRIGKWCPEWWRRYRTGAWIEVLYFEKS